MKTIVLVLKTMRKLLPVGMSALAIVGSTHAVDLSSVACPPGGAPDPRIDEYQIDDGVGENSIGLTAGGTLFWYNQFQVIAGWENISSVGVAWGQVAAGRHAEIQLFDDPNNDGNPQDVTAANLLWSVDAVSEGSNTDTFFQYQAPYVFVGDAGDYFFVGLCSSQLAGEYPARIDQTFSWFQSWVGGDLALDADCSNPNAGALGPLNIIDNYGLPGNWMVRASAGQHIPPPDPQGACCIGDQGECRIMYPWDCDYEGGQYMGDHTTCEPVNPCVPVPTVPSTWGSLKELFR